MKYDNPKLRQMLAAQYVLGTLRGRARRRFDRLARTDTALRGELRFWESRLAGLAADLPPQAPPPSVWLSLQHRIETQTPVVTPIRKPAPVAAAAAAPPPASPWRILAGLATAAAVVVAVLVGTRVPLPGEPAPVVATAPAPVAIPAPAAAPAVYVSLLKLPESDMQWTLAVKPTAEEVTAVASGAYPKLGEHSLELWLIADGKPVSLGLLPTAGEGTLKLPAGVAGAQLTLAVSLEPVGGSPTGQPTGPVLTSGPAIRAI